jgi:hypothetical protein
MKQNYFYGLENNGIKINLLFAKILNRIKWILSIANTNSEIKFQIPKPSNTL